MSAPGDRRYRMIPWTGTLETRLAIAVGTFLGSGYVPKAPGTAGSAAAIPLIFLTLHWSVPARILFWSLILLLGTWAARRIDELMSCGDHSAIVLDEVLGMGIATCSLSLESPWAGWLTAFLAFRLFDVWKPFPVRAVDRWSKSKAGWWGGFGVMADDAIAGCQALLAVALIQHYSNLF